MLNRLYLMSYGGLMKTLFFFVLITLTSLVTNLYAATYFVAQNGAGNGSGSSYSNRMSVAKHNKSTFQAGDIIYLCDKITTTISPKSNGTSEKPITYRGDYQNHTLLLAVDTSGGNSSINLTSRSNIILKNETVRAKIDGKITSGNINSSPKSNSCIRVSYAKKIVIDNWEIQNGWNAILGVNFSDISITRCYIHQMRANGIYFVDGTNLVIGGSKENGNELYQCTYKTQYISNDIGSDIRTVRVSNYICSYNHCHGTTGNDTDGWGMAGITSEGTSYGVFEYNTMHDHGALNFRAAMAFKGPKNSVGHHVIMRYNNIYDEIDTPKWDYTTAAGISIGRNNHNYWIYGNRVVNSGTGIVVSNDYNSGYTNRDGDDGQHVHDFYIWGNIVGNMSSTGIALANGYWDNEDDIYNIYIVNNTVSRAAQTCLKIDFTYKNADSGTAPFVTVKNNIFSEGNIDSNSMYLVDARLGKASYLSMDHNLYFDSTLADSFRIKNGRTNSSGCYNTPCEYNNANIPSTWFTNLSIGNPNFKNAESADLRINEIDSLAVDSGDTIQTKIPNVDIPFYSSTPIEFSFNQVLDQNTDWSNHPPEIIVADQDNQGLYDVGAYVYNKGQLDSLGLGQIQNVKVTTPLPKY